MYVDGGGRFGEQLTRGGKPVRRAPGAKPPCVFCPKIPPGKEPVPENAVELTPLGRRVYDHYHRCAGVNWQVPDAADPVVQFHAGELKLFEDALRADDLARAVAAAVRRRE